MALYRGPGGAGDATNNATSQAILAAASAVAAASSEAAAASSATSASNSATAASSSASAAASSEASVAANASNAATSATNAASSATAAANSASAASTSETNAASSASAASTSATNAANSATSAANSATTATTQATNASNSATAAATSATNAANSATSAATSETNAASSASAASTSATNAANSATSASTSASTSTTQASNAASSANAAATSASNAATSETNAAASATSAASSASTATTQATNSANSATASASSASSAAASAAAAAASYDSFDDRYLGSKTSDPALDNDGNALVTGALYYNSVAGEMRVYDGAIWLPASAASQAILTVYRYTATAGQTTFSGSDDSALTLAYTVGSVLVTLNGVTLEVGTDVIATTGTSVVLAVGAAAGDEVNIYAFSTFDIANTYTQAQTNSLLAGKIGTGAGTVTQANLAAGVAGNGPAFSAYQSVQQTGIANGVFTKVQLQTEVFDTNNNFDKDVNYRFTPTVAGYYSIVGTCAFGAAGIIATIYKNGSEYARGGQGSLNQSVASTILYCNGSTDYVELYVYQGSGSPQSLNIGTVYTCFSGCLVRAA